MVEGSAGGRPRDDVICGILALSTKTGRPLPEGFAAVFARVRPYLARTALEHAATLGHENDSETEASGSTLAALEEALARVTARRERLRRARELLPSLRGAAAGARAARSDVVFYFAQGELSGEGALVGAASLARTIDRERARSTGALAAVGSDGRLLHGAELTADAEALPVVPGLLGVAPARTASGGAASQWQLIGSVSALTVFLLVGLGVALRALRKEQMHTRARADFLTAVTHELKTPLASIRLLVDVLSDARASQGKRATYLERLAGEAARLTVLVENVLDLGRIERSERGYDLREEDLAGIVEDAVLLYRPLAARDGMEITVELDREDLAEETTDPDRWTAVVDRGALTQVLLNLFENARRYASAGGIIEVTAARAGRSFRLLVRDRGPGIPEPEREAIFERFRRGGAAHDAANPGVGLGLFLARAIARDHGGDLRCVARPGGVGATFELTLPLKIAAAGERPSAGSEAAGSPRAPPAGSVTP